MSLQNWILAALSAGTGSYFMYKTGFDKVILQTMLSVCSFFYVELMTVLFRGGTTLLNYLPTLPSTQHGELFNYWFGVVATLNHFLPIAEGTYYAFGFLTFVLVFATIKIVLKLIPTIG